MQSFRVGVLMGGRSVEREVSFNSGRTVCDHLDSFRYTIIPLFQTLEGRLYILPCHFLYRGTIADFEHRLPREAQEVIWDQLKVLIDFMYIAVHGRYAEDGTLQGFLEVLGIPYVGAKVYASAARVDKIIQKNILRAAGIAVAKGISVSPQQIANFETVYGPSLEKQFIEQSISFPCIVKPHKEGSSFGVSVVPSADQLYQALCNACYVSDACGQTVLIEECITGMEFSCIVITDYHTNRPIALPPTEIVPEDNTSFFDYEQKYMPGRSLKFTPARCSGDAITALQNTAIHVMQTLEITNIARIDGFLRSDNTILIIDVNTISGMGPTSFLFRQAAELNMNHTQIINHLIETELQSAGLLGTMVNNEHKERMIHDTKMITIAVLLGGNSHEREISLESGRNILYKLSPKKYVPIALFVTSTMELYRIDNRILISNATAEIEQKLEPHMKLAWADLPNIADFVFIALHGGAGENGSVQGALEMLNMPYNGSSVFASALCMDKYKTTRYLKHHDFDVAHSVLVSYQEWKADTQQVLQKIDTHITFPCIIKPHDDGCSFLVHKAMNEDAVTLHMNTLFASGKHYAMVEEYIQGMELTVGVLGNDIVVALPPSQAITTNEVLSIQEKFLPGAGENQTPAPLPPTTLELVQKTVADAYTAIGCKGYARIDCFYQSPSQSPTQKERVVILEVNTLPGMTPSTCIFHQAAEVGMNPMEFIDNIISLGFEQHQGIHGTKGLPTPYQEYTPKDATNTPS